MIDADELAALRRMAELEDRAAMTHASSVPETPQQNAGILGNIGLGGVNGASRIGSTILRPVDAATDLMLGQNGGMSRHDQRVDDLSQFFAQNSDPQSLAFRGGDLAASVAGTAGMGGLLAKGAGMIPALASMAPALASGGMTLGAGATASPLVNALMRTGAGAATGAASAGLSNPESAGIGAVIGGAIPGVAQLAGAAGSALSGSVSPEVAALYQKARGMGIEVPVDRLINSPALNAFSASLNYIPLSGRKAAENAMLAQTNRAASRTIGQDSTNLTESLRTAKRTLGQQFDTTLSTTPVRADNQLLQDLTDTVELAKRELPDGKSGVIERQADDILSKVGPTGEIEGRATYNIKGALDRIGSRPSEEAFYARQMRKKLIDALNRSLGPQGAQDFAKVRQQWGNMKELRKYAPNGAEGEISAARLGGLKDLNNQDLQDVADVAAQFVKTRENQHGAAQRVMLGGIGALGTAGSAMMGGGPLGALGIGALGVGTGMAAGRVANTALNSKILAYLLTHPQQIGSGADALLNNAAVRTLPIAAYSRQ